ncbi:MAG TPA: serine hydrolase domain-containing protein [Steroidobacteraceae bacterium]|nr:serine hydrolase domain-containing protein [Steroidobacteraceae bacterium]
MTSVSTTEPGLSASRLQYLKDVIEQDIARGLYRGASLVVARHGRIGLQVALGTHRSDDPRPLTTQSVFSLLSVTKALTNVLVLRAIERGQFSLQTKVASVIPEFAGGQRDRVTLFHLLTHTAGLPSVFMPVPGMYIDRLDEVIAAICSKVQSIEEPGRSVNYSPMANHALMGEMLRRTDPQRRSYRQIVNDELLQPLKMHDTSVGLRPDLRARHVRLEFQQDFPVQHLGHSNLGPHGAFEEELAEMPWVGVASTAPDMHRLAEMLRRGGELDGARILGPAVIDLATRVHTGEKPNELYRSLALARGWEPYPAYLGLGFSLRGDQPCPHQFGNLSSPRTFGNHGAGSTLFWVDPKLDMTFVCLTSGVMDEGDNIVRFQRLSDLALAAAT